MQTLNSEQLHAIARSQVDPVRYRLHAELLDKNADNTITPAERQELSSLRQESDLLMLRKSYAWSMLRWQGYRVPTLAEIPAPL